ncbi:MAG: alpha/beta fold hydrolase [Mycoplasmatales bacterium]
MQSIVINKTKVNYVKRGQGPAVLCLHGWGQSSQSFLSLIKHLENSFTVYAIDLPGFGESDEPEKPWSIFDYAIFIEKFIEKLQLTNVSVVAHSFGVRIAIVLASEGKITGKLVFTGGAGIKPKRSLEYYIRVYGYKFLKQITKTPLYKQFYDDVRISSGSSDYQKASEIMKKVLILAVNLDLTEKLSNIKNQALLYWGEEDEATPIEDGKKMNSLIKNSELIIRPRETHYSFLESAPIFNEAVSKFLRESKQ